MKRHSLKEKNDCSISEIDVVILAGGFGTRFASVVKDTPKILAPMGGRPLLDIIMDRLSRNGTGRVILCLGYLRDKVTAYVRNKSLIDDKFSKIEISEEENPLGTGGALKNAESLIRSDNFIVMNGDTLHQFNLELFHRFHQDNNGMLSILTTQSDRKDVGQIRVDDSGCILGFEERGGDSGTMVSAGLYIMRKQALVHMPDGEFSLEYDFFPEFVKLFPCHAFITDGVVLDIGTPERYYQAQNTYTPDGLVGE